MKWVVVSDNHGMTNILTDIKSIHHDADYYIHLGDSEFTRENPEIRDYVAVMGNCDGLWFDKTAVIEDKQGAFLTHGHLYSVNAGREQLAEAAEAAGCRFAFYGHTHVRKIEEIDGVICINPGSIAQSRSEEPETYLVIEDDLLTFYDQQHRIYAKEQLKG
ncbi:YfcE family phosphodiesterase [Macrococcus brunensis]|uniref:YfcE family phosphodiesterase n=1 Tax=Macrococcus brunensis TaxID=198483 RepID=UPI001EEFBC2C|nr:metallophosphoesterase [Macrococcus brunensis]ULG71252.1 metallophosphoesterase [Macrococcus brunensis]